MPNLKLPEISLVAEAAIMKGIKEGDNIVDMELLGLSQRNINLLEREGNITTLKQLMNILPERLLNFDNFGDKALVQVFKCLAHYHELDDLREIKDLP